MQSNTNLTQNPVSDSAQVRKESASPGLDYAGGDIPPSHKLAMRESVECKKKKGVIGDGEETMLNPVSDSGEVKTERVGLGSEDGGGYIPPSVKMAMEKAREYKIVGGEIVNLMNNTVLDPVEVKAESVNWGSDDMGDNIPPSVKLAIEKTREYKMNKGVIVGRENVNIMENPVLNPVKIKAESVNSGSDDITNNILPSVKLAMEKAREYKKNKGAIPGGNNIMEKNDSGFEAMKPGNLRDGVVEKRSNRKNEPTISSIDFLGLEFSDKKKTKGMPAGLVPTVDPFADGDLPEVELIVGDTSKFDSATLPKKVPEEDDGLDLYKPKVSTWGVFPRPSNVSKTYGGGRVIRPGEALESAEDKAAKVARTRQLLAAYKNKTGLIIDPKTKAECEKALKDGDYLMDLGKLCEALPYYEKVMKELAFQSELHGLAALQWSICQDSLSRPNEARVMYERLQSHPNVQVSKKAREFIFGFQAMEMMKISSYSKPTGYQNYFEAFVEDKPNYIPAKEEETEGSHIQALPYILFLIFPIFLVLFIVVKKVI